MTENKYLLLTPGPLTTTAAVKAAMLRDWCTWDRDYNDLVEKLRGDLVEMALRDRAKRAGYTAVLMQGSGTFAVESVIGSVIPQGGKLAVLSNGAYGRRIAEIAGILKVPAVELRFDECERPDAATLAVMLDDDPAVTHVAVVHCETTTGILNDIESVARAAKSRGKKLIVDAMSSFGGIPLFMDVLEIDFLISSANKCIEGVPGFAFVLANRAALSECAGLARSLSLDLYGQWKTMEEHGGKWRFTSPTHVVCAFAEALRELKAEGGAAARNRRYAANRDMLVRGMEGLGFKALLPAELRSPVITSFLYPDGIGFDFAEFYESLKRDGYVIYPGKLSERDTFRIGNIGDIREKQITGLLAAVERYVKRSEARPLCA